MPRLAVLATVLVSLSAAATPPPTVQRDVVGNLLEQLGPVKDRLDGDGPHTLCTPAPQVCIRTITGRSGDNSVVEILTAPGTAAVARLDYAPVDDRTVLKPWPFVVRLANSDDVLMGITEDSTVGYSGGGGAFSTLNLHLVSRTKPGGAWTVRNVLVLPISGSKMIRACFGEDDHKARHGACHDEYSYTSRLTLVPSTKRGKPRLALTTVATTYPSNARIDRNGSREKLRPSDLVTRRDPECSFRRTFTANAAWDFLPDTPLPDCSAYLGE